MRQDLEVSQNDVLQIQERRIGQGRRQFASDQYPPHVFSGGLTLRASDEVALWQ